MINNREGNSLSLSLYLFRERIEPLSREIWGRESGETGTRIINDLERQVFGDNRLQLLENSHVLLTRDRSFLSFFLSFGGGDDSRGGGLRITSWNRKIPSFLKYSSPLRRKKMRIGENRTRREE